MIPLQKLQSFLLGNFKPNICLYVKLHNTRNRSSRFSGWIESSHFGCNANDSLPIVDLCANIVDSTFWPVMVTIKCWTTPLRRPRRVRDVDWWPQCVRSTDVHGIQILHFQFHTKRALFIKSTHQLPIAFNITFRPYRIVLKYAFKTNVSECPTFGRIISAVMVNNRVSAEYTHMSGPRGPEPLSTGCFWLLLLTAWNWGGNEPSSWFTHSAPRRKSRQYRVWITSNVWLRLVMTLPSMGWALATRKNLINCRIFVVWDMFMS